MRANPKVARYLPALVVLHWLIAVLIVGNLAVGMLVLDGMDNADAGKAAVLRWHMLGGIAILVLMLARITVRLAKPRPAPAHAAGPLRWITALSHGLLYVLVLAMVMTGLGTAQLAGILPLLGGEAVRLPTDWSGIAPYAGHALFSGVLLAVLALHVVGWMYHLVRRDGLAGRMWFSGGGPD